MKAERMATFCLATGQSPEAYRRMTVLERAAFIDLVNRRC